MNLNVGMGYTESTGMGACGCGLGASTTGPITPPSGMSDEMYAEWLKTLVPGQPAYDFEGNRLGVYTATGAFVSQQEYDALIAAGGPGPARPKTPTDTIIKGVPDMVVYAAAGLVVLTLFMSGRRRR